MKRVSLTYRTCLALALCALSLFALEGRAEVLVEDFNDNSIDSALWTAYVYGSGPQIEAANQQLEIVIPCSSSGGDIGIKLASNFFLGGDFDVQVDFRLLTWSFANGVRLSLGMDQDFHLPHPGVERVSFAPSEYPGLPREAFLTDFPDGIHGVTATESATGSLRLVRSGDTQTGYYHGDGGWVAIHTGPAPTTDIAVKVAAWSGDQFMHWNVFAAFDNFIVNAGELIWAVPVQASTWGAVKALYR